jgi:hypothetical protein
MKWILRIWLRYNIAKVSVLEVWGEWLEVDHFNPEDYQYNKMAKFMNWSTYPTCGVNERP